MSCKAHCELTALAAPEVAQLLDFPLQDCCGRTQETAMSHPEGGVKPVAKAEDLDGEGAGDAEHGPPPVDDL